MKFWKQHTRLGWGPLKGFCQFKNPFKVPTPKLGSSGEKQKNNIFADNHGSLICPPGQSMIFFEKQTKENWVISDKTFKSALDRCFDASIASLMSLKAKAAPILANEFVFKLFLCLANNFLKSFKSRPSPPTLTPDFSGPLEMGWLMYLDSSSSYTMQQGWSLTFFTHIDSY